MSSKFDKSDWSHSIGSWESHFLEPRPKLTISSITVSQSPTIEGVPMKWIDRRSAREIPLKWMTFHKIVGTSTLICYSTISISVAILCLSIS